MIKKYQKSSPKFGKEIYISPDAKVIGKVKIGENVSIWPGAIVRGDINKIIIGNYSNIQDNCVLHVDPKYPLKIGNYVTIGHGAILHGCEIEDYVLIGINATILDGAKIGKCSIIGAGSVIPEKKEIPPYSLVVGVPGRIIKKLTEESGKRLKEYALHYWEIAKNYKK
ncbi:MAG: gamma carbonic anhydrase family protein [Actinobacteria bacterium]|nr:gamma carbonic anhydrase family protein [Actinomycetota bacterium]